MTLLRSFALFWYDFIVGDDWLVAVAVVAALVAMALLLMVPIAAWWLLPLAVVAALWFSLQRATAKK